MCVSLWYSLVLLLLEETRWYYSLGFVQELCRNVCPSVALVLSGYVAGLHTAISVPDALCAGFWLDTVGFILV